MNIAEMQCFTVVPESELYRIEVQLWQGTTKTVAVKSTAPENPLRGDLLCIGRCFPLHKILLEMGVGFLETLCIIK